MWVESWPNLIMKMRDMPYYSYKKRKVGKKEEPEAKEGTVDVLKDKFKKYIQK